MIVVLIGALKGLVKAVMGHGRVFESINAVCEETLSGMDSSAECKYIVRYQNPTAARYFEKKILSTCG